MDKVTSRDGTPIAFDRLGDGPPVILVCGATCDRALMHPTAEELAKHFTVFNYDRRGRGDSAVPLKNSAEASCPTQTPATHSAGSL
jgi:pimeloyl-ACP methyl ester carboxylesterase